MRSVLVASAFLVSCLLCAVTAAAQDIGTLVIETRPPDALVRIMNIAPPYESGMALEPGVYDIEVSKDGYVTERRDVTVEAGKENRFTFALEEAPPEGTLVVATEPEDATVRVMNIAPPYEPGMSLPEGEYELEISKPGYEAVATTVTLEAGQENTFSLSLAPEESGEAAADAVQAEPSTTLDAANGTLTVTTDPAGATVRIMNIRPPYEDGIVLEPGSYEIAVSHPGYESRAMEYTVEAGEAHTVNVALDPVATEPVDIPAAEAPRVANATHVDEFENNEHQWYETTSPQVEIAIRDGSYRIDHKNDSQGWIAWNAAGLEPNTEFAIEAEFRKVDGVLDYGYGLLWGVTRDAKSYHSFRISGNGLYSYRYEDAGNATTIIDWTPSGAIAPGLGATNTIHIRRVGDTLAFYVNGLLVDTTPYIPALGTMVGFKVDNRQVVEVERLVVGHAE